MVEANTNHKSEDSSITVTHFAVFPPSPLSFIFMTCSLSLSVLRPFHSRSLHSCSLSVYFTNFRISNSAAITFNFFLEKSTRPTIRKSRIYVMSEEIQDRPVFTNTQAILHFYFRIIHFGNSQTISQTGHVNSLV